MCRWFAYISKSEEILLEDALIVPEHAIARQVAERFLPFLAEYEPGETPGDTEKEIALRNRFFNADGLGLAWYDTTRERFHSIGGRRPTVYKIVRQPLTDPNFTSLCENTASLAVFSHIRAASPGTAITAWNAHPFHFGRYILMHNGDFAYWDRIKIKMCQRMSLAAFNHILGSTDSEHFAALMFTFLAESVKEREPLRTAPDAGGAPQRPETLIGDADDIELIDLKHSNSLLGDVKLGGEQIKDFGNRKLDQLRVGDQKLCQIEELAKDLKKVRRIADLSVEDVEKALPVWEHRYELSDLREAVEKTIQQIIIFQLEAAAEENGGLPIEHHKLLASNINIALSDGYQLLAIRCRNHPTEFPPSLYVSKTAGPYLNRAFVGNPNDDTAFNPYVLNFDRVRPAAEYKEHFIICSEPTTFNEEDWKLVEKNTGVLVDENMNETWFNVNMGLD